MAGPTLLQPRGPPCPSGSRSILPQSPLAVGGPNSLRLKDPLLKHLTSMLDSLLTSCEFLEGLEGKGCARTPLSPLVARQGVLWIGPRGPASGRERQMAENVLSQPSSQHPEG